MSAIVGDKNTGKSEPADDILPYKTMNACLGDGGKGLGLYPFGKIVVHDYGKFHLTFPFEHRSD